MYTGRVLHGQADDEQEVTWALGISFQKLVDHAGEVWCVFPHGVRPSPRGPCHVGRGVIPGEKIGPGTILRRQRVLHLDDVLEAYVGVRPVGRYRDERLVEVAPVRDVV